MHIRNCLQINSIHLTECTVNTFCILFKRIQLLRCRSGNTLILFCVFCFHCQKITQCINCCFQIIRNPIYVPPQQQSALYLPGDILVFHQFSKSYPFTKICFNLVSFIIHANCIRKFIEQNIHSILPVAITVISNISLILLLSMLLIIITSLLSVTMLLYGIFTVSSIQLCRFVIFEFQQLIRSIKTCIQADFPLKHFFMCTFSDNSVKKIKVTLALCTNNICSLSSFGYTCSFFFHCLFRIFKIFQK
ncbi:hypothetical protein DORLON_00778 [Dorea longicatena DSM 13814]|uniref:Transmembrane protein n=1 Tax=Dorea longicatena DSM 13814 TaxID=411462 RepID=A6BEQ9_9FIRM|nr:hypothetical protein DORLON_00778 [Dorea longicatena DSM 13814]